MFDVQAKLYTGIAFKANFSCTFVGFNGFKKDTVWDKSFLSKVHDIHQLHYCC